MNMGKGKAIEVKQVVGFQGDARKYRLDPPVNIKLRWDDEADAAIEFVIVSAVNGFAHETYIFPATEEHDEPTDWGELDGSYRGDTNHQRALLGLGDGYEIAVQP